MATLAELQRTPVKKSLQLGRQNVTFVAAEWDEQYGQIEGLRVKTKERTPIYIKIFDNDNMQLDYFFNAVGCDVYDVDEANKAYGTILSVEGYKNKKGYINPNFGPKDHETKEDTEEEQ